jgi:hypothetical protein
MTRSRRPGRVRGVPGGSCRRTDQAARHIAGLVRELYTSLARPPREVRIQLRAAQTFKPDASRLLGELLEDIQHKLTADGGPRSADK